MECPVLIEADHSSLFVGWSRVDTALQYELEMKTGDGEWVSLSSSIKSNAIRKKNLTSEVSYTFRIRAQFPSGWDVFSGPSEAMHVLTSDVSAIGPPTLKTKDASSVTVEWEVPEKSVDGYALRYREENSVTWNYVDAVIHSNIARKKGLQPRVAYCFSVKPLGDGWAYSKSSQPFSVSEMSQFMKNLFPSTLLSKGNVAVNTADALAGKVVGVYFSAHWCGPCRQFTPQLANLYQQIKATGKSFEIVFCSADNSEEEFNSYYSSMPWLAINYTDDEREQFMAKFKVSGIPKLCILAPSGQFLAENAVTMNLSPAQVDLWVNQCQQL